MTTWTPLRAARPLGPLALRLRRKPHEPTRRRAQNSCGTQKNAHSPPRGSVSDARVTLADRNRRARRCWAQPPAAPIRRPCLADAGGGAAARSHARRGCAPPAWSSWSGSRNTPRVRLTIARSCASRARRPTPPRPHRLTGHRHPTSDPPRHRQAACSRATSRDNLAPTHPGTPRVPSDPAPAHRSRRSGQATESRPRTCATNHAPHSASSPPAARAHSSHASRRSAQASPSPATRHRHRTNARAPPREPQPLARDAARNGGRWRSPRSRSNGSRSSDQRSPRRRTRPAQLGAADYRSQSPIGPVVLILEPHSDSPGTAILHRVPWPARIPLPCTSLGDPHLDGSSRASPAQRRGSPLPHRPLGTLSRRMVDTALERLRPAAGVDSSGPGERGRRSRSRASPAESRPRSLPP